MSIQKACRGTLGFPAVLPHSDPLSSAGKSSISISIAVLNSSFSFPNLGVTDCWSYLFLVEIGVSPINNNKTSHFLNGIVIGSMSTLALALIAVLGFLWICLLSRKKSIGGNYVKMDKQTLPDGNEFDTISYCFH